MNATRKAAVAVAALRIVYGAALAAAPARTTKSWLGADAALPAGTVALRGMGAREIAVHAGMAAAALAGAPVRPWLVVSIAGDCADVASTFAADSSRLPDKSAIKTLVVAGGSAAVSAAVLSALDD